jgi:hypothetical protein
MTIPILSKTLDRPFRAVTGILSLTAIGLAIAGIGRLIVQPDLTHFWPIISHTSRGNIRDLVLVGLLAFGAGVATAGIVVYGGVAITIYILEVAVYKRRPDLMVVNILAGLLEDLTARSTNLSSVQLKAHTCGRLQLAASYLQDGVIKVVGVADPGVRTTLYERLRASAAYLREMQLWVVLANEKTPDELRSALVHYISVVVRGEYDLLPSSDMLATESSRLQKLTALVRTFIISVIPFTIIIGVRYSGVSISPQFTGWAVIVAIAWAAITLISLLDPLYKERIADIGGLISSIRGSGN